MIDFPALPSVGDTYSSNGLSWTWDGSKWVAIGLSGGPFLPLAGGTLTGYLMAQDLFISSSHGLYLQAAAAGITRPIYSQNNGSMRWMFEIGDGSAESGSNSGSNVQLTAYGDSGNYLNVPLSVNRATGAVSIPNLNSPGVFGKNKIINGDMRIDQRNSVAGITANNVYTVDRFKYSCNLGTNIGIIGQRLTSIAGPPGFYYYLGFQNAGAHVSAASDICQIIQYLEADTCGDLGWGAAGALPITLSFWAWSSIAGTLSGRIGDPTGGRCYCFTYSIPVASTWTKITITIPGDTATGWWYFYGNGNGLVVSWDLGCGSTYRGPPNVWQNGAFSSATGAVNINTVTGGTFLLGGVKLETGTIATPFERESLAKCMADCQRYYQTGQLYLGTQAGVAGQAINIGTMPVTATRAQATITALTNGNINWTQSTLTQSPMGMIYAGGTSVAAGATTINMQYSANAEF